MLFSRFLRAQTFFSDGTAMFNGWRTVRRPAQVYLVLFARLSVLTPSSIALQYAMDCALRAAGMETSGEQSDKLVKPLQ